MAETVKISEQYELEAPITYAYDFLTDLRNDKLWYPAVRDIRIVPGQPGADPGVTTYQQSLTMLGLRYTSTIQVDRVQPPVRAELRAVSSRVPFVCAYDLLRVSPTTTRLVVTAEVSASGPLRLLGPLFKVALLRRVRSHFARLPEALRQAQTKSPDS